MGGPMAGHLLKAGHDVTVWNRSEQKTEPFGAAGATVADSLSEVGETCDVVFLCVGTTEDVEQCLEPMVDSAQLGTLFVDHSTISPVGAKRIHSNLKSQGMRFIDAPITGGSMGAKNGTLTIFCGGEEADFDDALPYMEAYGRLIRLVGGPAAGETTKMANQIAVGGALLGLCEALSFAKKAGLDLEETRQLLSTGAAGSWAFDNYGPMIVAEDWSPGFSVKNQRKDFGYCMESAEDLGASIPGTELVDRLLKVLADKGEEDVTTAALYKVLLETEPRS